MRCCWHSWRYTQLARQNVRRKRGRTWRATTYGTPALQKSRLKTSRGRRILWRSSTVTWKAGERARAGENQKVISRLFALEPLMCSETTQRRTRDDRIPGLVDESLFSLLFHLSSSYKFLLASHRWWVLIRWRKTGRNVHERLRVSDSRYYEASKSVSQVN